MVESTSVDVATNTIFFVGEINSLPVAIKQGFKDYTSRLSQGFTVITGNSTSTL
jgi:hypothetical protein